MLTDHVPLELHNMEIGLSNEINAQVACHNCGAKKQAVGHIIWDFEKQFPNGITSYKETHFEMVSLITQSLHLNGSLTYRRNEEQGTGGLYELADELTLKFENFYKNEEWVEKDFFEEIENFFDIQNKSVSHSQ